MANSSKDQTEKDQPEIEDAVELPVSDEQSASSVDDDSGREPSANSEEDIDSESAAEATLDDVAEAEPEPAAVQSSDRSAASVFFPMLLGGVAAGAIGYAIAIYGPVAQERAALSAQLGQANQRLDQLEANATAPVEMPDLSGVEAQISRLTAQMSDATSELSAQIADLSGRIQAVERQLNTDGTLSDTALAAYQNQLDVLRAEMDAQSSQVMSAAAQAEANLAAARAEAERLEQQALAAAETASKRAALNRIAAAVETGAPFADALTALQGMDLPAALTDAASSGVATTAELAGDFPAAARAALAVARAEGLSDDASGIGGFLRSQFDVRSTTPREGLGPDAVLSRAEAAVKEGRTADALAELDALPEVVRAEITDWTARAQRRADVQDALVVLSENFN